MLSDKASGSEKPQFTKDLVYVLITYFDNWFITTQSQIKKEKTKEKHCNIKKSEYKYCTSKQHLVPSA